jgi:uncharacterized protein (DUF1800 family)
MKRLLPLRLSVVAAIALACTWSLAADDSKKSNKDGDPIAAAEAAVQRATGEETAAETEWNSLEMARSATREIARAERDKTAGALLATVNALKAAVAASHATQGAAESAEQRKSGALAKAYEDCAAARSQAEQRLASLRVQTERMIAETRTANQAALNLYPAEDRLRDKMAARRDAECKLLKVESQTAAAPANDSQTTQRTVAENRALALWETQSWAKVQAETASQIVEQSGQAADLARKIAEIDTDPARQAAWSQFEQEQRKYTADAEAVIAKKRAEAAALAARIYSLRATAIGGLTPLDPKEWDHAKARHLLARAGFGGTPAEVDKLCKLGLHGAVDYLLEFHRQPAPQTPFEAAPPEPADPLAAKLRNAFVQRQATGRRGVADGGQIAALRRAWLRRMVESPRPLQEKLTLFWHGLFATQNSVVQNSYAMQRQNELFRNHAAGNYGGLLYGLVHDAAMIRYLDNNRNVQGHPNENLAREIMELFSMGVDQGYTEKDIIEAARALTGYTYDNRSGAFRYRQDLHDNTDKCIFGKVGPWTGDDLVRLILDQPTTGRFISRRLFEFFAYPDPEAATVESLANVLKAHKYEVEPLLRNLLLSAEFYSERSRGQAIKCPVQLVVGTVRDLGAKKGVDYAQLDAAIREMGQDLFEPPDVKGWRYGREWINSQRLFVRYNTAASLARAATDPGRGGVDLIAFVPDDARQSPEAVVAYLSGALLIRPLDDAQRKALVDFCCDLPAAEAWREHADAVRSRLQELVALLASLPEFQMT